MATLSINEAMGFVVFGLGAVLILLGIILIVLQAILESLLRRLLGRVKAKVDVQEVGPWDFMLKLLEELFAAIKELPEPLRVAFLLIIFGTILLVLGYSMATGIWPLG